MVAHTEFSQYSHAQLVSMLFAGDPATARSAGDTWDGTARSLHERADDLSRQLSSFEDQWEGDAADQYRTMIADLAGGIRKVADTALSIRDLTYSAAESLTEAQQQMPQPVPVPDLSPTVVQLATTPLPTDLAPDVYSSMASQQTSAVQSVRDYQAAASAADAAHQQAIQIMTNLAGSYTTTEESMPATPQAAPAPSTPDSSGAGDAAATPAIDTGAIQLQPVGDTGTDTTTAIVATGAVAATAASPLFGQMFSAGLAAASAASAGRFGGVLPRLPGFMRRNGKKRAGKQPAGSTAGTGGGTGTGGTGAGDSGTGGSASEVDQPSLTASAPGTATSAGLTAAGAAAAGASAAGRSGMGMMPMMPMSGAMGVGDMGGARRIPPWLVETENVWGESAIVAPPVIGEES